MLPLERHRLIVELLGQHGVMRVNEIAQATRVSRETIRRDLSELERKGILTRSHGGALAAENPLPATRAAASALPVEDSQGSFQHRTLLHSEGKMRVARKALQFLQPGQTIVLDGQTPSHCIRRPSAAKRSGLSICFVRRGKRWEWCSIPPHRLRASSTICICSIR